MWNRIRASMPPTNGSDPDLAIFVIDLQDANKKLILKKVLCFLLFEGRFNFSKIRSPNEVTKLQESTFFLLFLLDDKRTIEGSGPGSIPLTNGSGSGGAITYGS